LAEIRAARVKIGNDVWIGHAVTVLAGVAAGVGTVPALRVRRQRA
jgi:acetyltransferase-like isoleucine patch superfamily enzyme